MLHLLRQCSEAVAVRVCVERSKRISLDEVPRFKAVDRGLAEAKLAPTTTHACKDCEASKLQSWKAG
eukprot:scaffold146_cov265-Pinguiococcus_pyrenoidosus.AAC.8